MLMHEWEQHKTDNHAYVYVAGVLTCLCLYYPYACAYAYALVRTSLKSSSAVSETGLRVNNTLYNWGMRLSSGSYWIS